MANFIENQDGVTPVYQLNFTYNGNSYSCLVSLNESVGTISTDDFETTLSAMVWSLSATDYTSTTVNRLDEAETNTNVVTLVPREVLVSADGATFGNSESFSVPANTITPWSGYVKLNTAPTGTVTISTPSVAYTAVTPNTLTFTTSNWNTAQEISGSVHSYGFTSGQLITAVGASDEASLYAEGTLSIRCE